MVYFVYQSYIANSATMNRAIAYFRHLDNYNYPINVAFFLPDNKFSRINESFSNISICYFWDHYYINNVILKYLSYIIYIICFVLKLRKDDIVYIYGLDDMKNIIQFFHKNIIYEHTEHPEASLQGSALCHPSLKSHISFCKKVRGLVVISQSLKDYYISMGIRADKIHIINMFVDINRFRNVTKKSNRKRYIAYCGSILNKKDGVDDLLIAFSMFIETNPDIELYIIGEMPLQQDRDCNLKLLYDLNLQERVHFTGAIDYKDIPQILVNAEALVLARPSNIQSKYGFPTKLGEYLMTGNPVVITDVGDMRLFLKDMKDIVYAEANNPKDFADKLSWVISHPNESKVIGCHGKNAALLYFNSEIESQKLYNLLFCN